MKKVFLALITVAALAILAAPSPAQSKQNANTELSISAQVVRVEPNFNRANFRFNQGTDQIGIAASLAHFFGKSSFGLTGEVGFSTKSKNASESSLVTVMAGPVIARRRGLLQPSVRALVGMNRLAASKDQLSIKFDDSNTGLAYDVGAALDVRISPRVRLRLLSGDYLATRNFGQTTNHARAGAGLVFGF